MLKLVYPPRCLGCNAQMEQDGRLCGSCRGETPFIDGLVCDCCGAPLPGDIGAGLVHCDDCLTIMRPWVRGRAALKYKARARALVMAFKHGDRQELARPLAGWMAKAATPILGQNMIVVPVPIHWTRMLKRQYTQSVLLAREFAALTGQEMLPDALVRNRRTKYQDGMNRAERFANISGSIVARARTAARIRDREILLIDDVMTSGATLSATAEAAHLAGAARINVVVLARVCKDV